MQLTILGSNGTYPTAGRPASGYLVSHEGTTMWMDAGPGTFMALADLMDPLELDAVFLSHRHPDHCADIFALFHARAYGRTRRDPIPVIVPEGLRDVLCDFVGRSADTLCAVFDFQTATAGDEFEVGSLSIRVAEASHPVPTIAPRITGGGKTLTYTADTGPTTDLDELAKGSDVLLAESTHGGPADSEDFPYHLTAAQAGAMAAAAGVRRLMLTHIAPYVDPNQSIADAESTFTGEVSVAVPGTRHTI